MGSPKIFQRKQKEINVKKPSMKKLMIQMGALLAVLALTPQIMRASAPPSVAI